MKNISDVVGTAVERSLRGFASQLGAIGDSPAGLYKNEALRIIRWIEIRFSQKPGEDVKNEILFLAQHLLEGYKQNPELNGIPNYVATVFRRLGNVPALTMIPSCYDRESQQFESSGSLLSDISTIRTLLASSIRVVNTEYTLTADQFHIWNTLNNATKCCGISAPTSAGKSFVISLYVASVCSKKKVNVVYLVPTHTLIDQVSSDLKNLIKTHNIDGYSVKNHITEDISLENHNVIFVMTQERFAIGQSYLKKNRIQIGIAIVDEVQNIEKIEEESDDRSHILYEVIRNIYDDFSPTKFILSGPRIGNIKEINEFLFYEQASSFTTSSSPVVSLSYSFKLDGLKLYLRAHASFLAKHVQIQIDNKYIPYNVFGATQYDADTYSVIDRIVNSLESESGVLIFSPTKKQAESTSSSISDRRGVQCSNDVLDSLISYIRSTVHINYRLVQCLENKVVFHHRNMPEHVRNCVEYAFKNKIVAALATTTTLMQGVNLPAKYIIAKNPYLETRGKKARLSCYDFGNLRGRAGRLMKDFVGIAIIIDEESFEDSEIDLFKSAEKEIHPSYSDKFLANEHEIVEIIMGANKYPENKPANEIATLIKNAIMTYGEKAKLKLERYGIEFEDSIFDGICSRMVDATDLRLVTNPVSRIDPFEIARILKSIKKDKVYLPTNIWSSDFVDSLQALLIWFSKQNYSPFNKEFPRMGDKYAYSLAITASKWGREVPLREIISWKQNATADDIDDNISKVLDHVSYRIPKVLYPIYSNLEIETNFITSIETGVSTPSAVKLIESGVPREVILSIMQIAGKSDSWITSIKDVKTRLGKRLNRWEMIQLPEE